MSIIYYLSVSSVSSVTQSCLTLCDPMNCSTPGLPVHHQLQEFSQTQVHQVSDAIQPSHPLSSPSPPCPQSLPASESFPMSQLLAWGGQSTGVSGRGKKISVLRDRNSSGTSSTLRKKESQNNQKDDGSVFTFIPIILPLNSVLSKGQKKNKGKQLYYHMLTIFWVIKSYTS